MELFPYDELTYDLGFLMKEGFIVLAVNNISEAHVEKKRKKMSTGPCQ